MKKQLSRSRWCWLSEIVGIAVVLVIAVTALIYLGEAKTQREIAVKEERVKELWQEYMAKNPNEDDLWNIVRAWYHAPEELKKLAACALVEKTSSREHLIHLLDYYNQEKMLRIKISDKLLQDPSLGVLKNIINKVPERAELAVPILVNQTNDPNIIGYNCFRDIITNAPTWRKWAWENVLSRPDWIRIDIRYCFLADLNFPNAAADAYFGLDLQPDDYRWVIKYIDRLRSKAWKELMSTKPKNEEISKILYWAHRYPAEIKIPAAEYLLANNPSEDDLKLIEQECPSLKEKLREEWKKFRERKIAEEKERLRTKEGILEQLESLL